MSIFMDMFILDVFMFLIKEFKLILNKFAVTAKQKIDIIIFV